MEPIIDHAMQQIGTAYHALVEDAVDEADEEEVAMTIM